MVCSWTPCELYNFKLLSLTNQDASVGGRASTNDERSRRSRNQEDASGNG